MLYVDCDQTTYFDVDQTLIMWGYTEKDASDGAIPIDNGDFISWVKPHKKHIEKLKQHKTRGHTTVLWSAGGSKWAKRAVEALNLEQYVDLVIEKPKWFYDDCKAEEFMPEINRVYYKDE